jgi:hypothetical protein
MAKRNKIRYQSKDKPLVTLIASGNVYLEYVDDEALAVPKKGDFKVYPYHDALQGVRMGDYDNTGFSGYFKVDVFDGWQWKIILMNEVFIRRENYFSKKERPIDTYAICLDILKAMAGKTLIRTYREHYFPEGAPPTISSPS